MCEQPLDDLLDRAGSEAGVDPLPPPGQLPFRCGLHIPVQGLPYGRAGEVVDELPQRLGRYVVVGEPGQECVPGADLSARQREVCAEFARGEGEEVGAADVRDEADAGLGHGDPRPLGDDPDAAVRGDADAAAHDDAVHDGDVGLGVAGDAGVEVVLVAPERGRGGAVPVAGVVVDAADVAARAQAALPRTGDDDGLDGRVPLPVGQGLVDAAHHGVGEGVEGLGTVEDDVGGTARRTELDVGHPSASVRPRATMTRMISLVPSRI